VNRDQLTLREFYRLLGSLIWVQYAKRRPLWCHAEALEAMSALLRRHADKPDWDDAISFPAWARSDINSWIHETTQNDWLEAPSMPFGPADLNDARWYCFDDDDSDVTEPLLTELLPPDGTMAFSDASSYGAAFVVVKGGKIVLGRRWHLPPGQLIYMSELDALVEAARECPMGTLGFVDNATLYYVCRRGHSALYTANTKLRSVFGMTWPRTLWLPTYQQLADPFSRRDEMPDCPFEWRPWTSDTPPDIRGTDTRATSSNRRLRCLPFRYVTSVTPVTDT